MGPKKASGMVNAKKKMISIDVNDIFLSQKYITRITGVIVWELERINCISMDFNREICFEIRAN